LLLFVAVLSLFFFFQAEDGIRDFHVTGVQTCALPISFIWIEVPAPFWLALLPLIALRLWFARWLRKWIGGFTGDCLGALQQLSEDRKSTRLNSSHVKISYAVFCLKKKKKLKLD